MAQTNTPLFGYPQPWGSKYQMIFDHIGPTSYGNIGTSSGTGDIIKASDLGFGGIEQVGAAFGGFCEFYTASGNYLVKMFTASSATTPSVSLPAGSAVAQIVLQWFTTAAPFGAISTEVANAANLSAETLRMMATLV